MSEFCKQCSDDLFPPDMGGRSDFAGLTTKADWADGKAAVVLCEGCGAIQVDPAGRCVSKDCAEQHGLYPECAGCAEEANTGGSWGTKHTCGRTAPEVTFSDDDGTVS